MTKVDEGGMNSYLRRVAIVVALGSLTYGCCSAVIGYAIGQPGWYAYFNLPPFGEPGYGTTTTNAISTANGLYMAGGAIGSLTIMWSAEAYGRKVNIQIGGALATIGGILQGGAAALSMFHVGRIVAGIGIGILVTVCPMYLSEVSPPNIRGWLVGHHAIFLVTGYNLAAWTGVGCYFATPVNPNFAWRFPLCIQILPSSALLITSFWLPQSPRWLVSKGLTQEAWTILQRLRKSPQDVGDVRAREEFLQIQEQLRIEAVKLAASGSSAFKASFTKKSYRKRMLIGFLTQWGAEFSGPLVINNYSVILYTGLGMTGYMPLVLSSVWTLTAMIYNPFGAWLHDKVNSRRKMFMFGTFGCLITVSLLAAMTARFAGTTNKAGNSIGILAIFLYLAFQGTFCDTTMYLYVSEIFPMEIRPIGMGFSLFGQFSATIIMLQTAPIGFVHIGWKYYLLIICWCIVFIPMIYLFWPETARLSLEEIAAQFGDEVAVDIHAMTDDQRAELDKRLEGTDVTHLDRTLISNLDSENTAATRSDIKGGTVRTDTSNVEKV